MKRASWKRIFVRLGGIVCAGALFLLALPGGVARASLEATNDATAQPSFPVLATPLIDPSLLPPDPIVASPDQLAAAGVGATGTASMPSFANSNTLVVDDDRQQCPTAQFTGPAGIEEAVQAALPGQTITVCPGTYTSVTVDKANLTVYAPRQQGTANNCPMSPPDPTKNAIIQDVNPAGLVQVTAPGVVVDGFTIQNNPKGPGVRTGASGSGYQLDFNVIEGNRIGIDLSSDGAAQTEIQHSCFRENVDVEGNGREIASSSGFSNVLIAQNDFAGSPPGDAIDNCVPALPPTGCPTGGPANNVVITHNDCIGDGDFGLLGGSNVTISYNRLIRCFGAAIITDSIVNVVIDSNLIDGQGQPLTQGIAVSGPGMLNAEVKSNVIENLVGGFVPLEVFGFGVTLRGGGIVVENNQIAFDKGSGVFLGAAAHGDTIRNNLIVGNGVAGTSALPRNSSDGIKILQGAVGNTIDNNRLGAPLSSQQTPTRENVDYDCHDNNPPGANVWTHNVGYTENEPGLCVKTTP